MRHSGLFANIQLLRFIAAAMVVGFHAVPANYGIQGEVTTYAKWAWHGGFGVDIFFVISGFVISATTLDKSRNLISSLDFTRKRFMRIYLGYWPFFLWAIVQTWLLAEDRLPNIDFLGSFFLTETNHLKLILSVSWSLTYELYFYCIFACLFLFSRIKTVIFVHILFVLILLRAIYVPLDESTYMQFFASAFLLEFLAGVLLFIHIDRFNSDLWLLFCAGTFLVVMGSGFDTIPAGDQRVFQYGPAALALVLFAVLLEKNGWYKSGRLGIELGDASYTLYLSHSLLLELFVVFLVQPILSHHPGLFGQAIFVLALFLIVALSYLGFRFIERPVYRWSVQKSANWPAKVSRKILQLF